MGGAPVPRPGGQPALRPRSPDPWPKDGDLVYGSAASQGSTLIRCSWVDDTTAGDVLYANGAAAGLADAAAKTNQARGAVER